MLYQAIFPFSRIIFQIFRPFVAMYGIQFLTLHYSCSGRCESGTANLPRKIEDVLERRKYE
jgi:hypothetical protein